MFSQITLSECVSADWNVTVLDAETPEMDPKDSASEYVPARKLNVTGQDIPLISTAVRSESRVEKFPPEPMV